MAKLAMLGGRPVARLKPPPWPVHDARDERRILRVLRSGAWSWMGEMETAFNQAWAKFNGSKHSLLVTNGTHALQMAYEALDLGWGDEVLVPGITFQATAAAALDINAVPVLVDVDPATWCIDPKAAEAAITSRTRAIALVHLYGGMADMDAIMDLARRHGLYVVEDCAHAQGSQWRGRAAGTIGDAGAYSFQQTKTMTAGEGGAILVQDDRLFGRLDQLRNCGHLSPHLPEGAPRYLQSGNFRISEWQAAILLGQLERLPGQLRRQAAANRLTKVLAKAPGVAPLKRPRAMTRHSYYGYGFRFLPEEWEGVSKRAFCSALSAETGLGFWGGGAPLNQNDLYQPHTKQRHRISGEYLQQVNPARFDLPNAERVWREQGVSTSHSTFMLPPSDMDKVGEAIEKLYQNRDELRRLSA